MSESSVAFFYRIASCLPLSENNQSLQLLRSFYLMRCKEITGGFGLPSKHFSRKARCPRCCLEWDNKTDVKIKTIKLSTRQKQRIKSKKISKSNENKVNLRKALLKSNQMNQTCSFCKHTTVTTLPKPVKEYPKKGTTSSTNTKTASINKKPLAKDTNTEKIKSMCDTKNKKVESIKKNSSSTNVYSNTFDVFSLKNKQNTLASTIKEPAKIINNNKRKKDKFAGLCQKAVLASAKIKQDKGQDKKQNKLSLFLKPSLG